MKNIWTNLFWRFVMTMTFLGISGAGVAAEMAYETVFESAPIEIRHRGQISPRYNFLDDILAGSPWSTEQVLKAALESNHEDIRNYVTYDSDGNTIWNKKFHCGKFEMDSIGALRAKTKETNLPGGGSFHVIDGYETKWNLWFAPFVDVAYLQALPENNNAVFQVSSNFDGLESTSPYQKISETWIQNYYSDYTQGPAAVISAAPGIFLRRYLLGHSPEKEISEWGQTEHRPVNFLSDISAKIRVSKAGYVVFNDDILKEENAPNDSDYEAMKIGFHRNIQVTNGAFGISGDHYSILKEEPIQTIHQAFVAAIDFKRTNAKYFTQDNAQKWGQKPLDLAYEGTLLKAYLIGAKKVFLTMVGGGVFGNDPNWIFGAMKRMENFIKDSGLSVHLVFRSTASVQDEALRQKLLVMVENLGGSYVQHRQDGSYRLKSRNKTTVYDKNY